MTSLSANAYSGSPSSPSASRLELVQSQTRSASSTTSPSTSDLVDPAGADLAAKLQKLERHVDAAYAASGELAAAVVRAKSAHRLSAVVGHSIFSAIDEASSALVSARGHTVKSHRLLEQLAKSLNIPHAYGDDQKDLAEGFIGA